MTCKFYFRTKKVTAEYVVNTFIERCKQINGLLNVIVDERFNDAIEEAKNVDKLLASSINVDTLKATKPLLGVPFTTKESNAATGN